jgi:hypothetical protein
LLRRRSQSQPLNQCYGERNRGSTCADVLPQSAIREHCCCIVADHAAYESTSLRAYEPSSTAWGSLEITWEPDTETAQRLKPEPRASGEERGGLKINAGAGANRRANLSDCPNSREYFGVDSRPKRIERGLSRDRLQYQLGG